jgi:hypothetical protein
MRTLSRTMCLSPARTRRATSSSVKYRHRLSYDWLEPVRANFSRSSPRVSTEQKQRYACPDCECWCSTRHRYFKKVRAHREQFCGVEAVEVKTLRLVFISRRYQTGDLSLPGNMGRGAHLFLGLPGVSFIFMRSVPKGYRSRIPARPILERVGYLQQLLGQSASASLSRSPRTLLETH